MKIRTILLTGSLVLLGACSESKYELQNLVPDEYHKIMYVNNSGKQEVTLYDTEADNHYTFSVFKAGSDPDQTANVSVGILTQTEVDSEYSEPEGVNYKVISADCYSLDATNLAFSTADRYKLVNISLKPQNVKTIMETDPSAVWVLPLQLTSDTDSINADKNGLFLQISGVITPTLGFTNTDVAIASYNYGTTAITAKIAMGLDTDNQWDIVCNFGVDEDYIAEYNADNGTSFKLLPEGAYTLPESMTLTSGITNTELTVTVNSTELKTGDYMLPIRITEISQFEIFEKKAIYPLTIRIMGTALDRTGWTGEANTEELAGEGTNGKAGCALDGNISTYWHSVWLSGNWVSLPFEIIVDTQTEHTFTQFGLQQRQHESCTDTKSGKFYVSSDKKNWTEVGPFSLEKIFMEQIFSITPTKGRYFKVSIEETYRGTNASLSEIYAYGLD